MLRRLSVLVLVLASVASFVSAQDAPPPAPPPAEEPVAETPPPPAEVPVAEPTAETPDRPRWERTIYVPFRELEKVFDKEGEGVYVPRKEFEELWRKAMDRPDRPARPTSPFLITRAEYTGRVEGDLAVVKAVIDIESFREGWVEIPLGLTGVALGKATLDGEPATLSLVKGSYRLFAPSAKRHRLAVEFVASIREGKDGRSVTFGCPPVPVARLDFTVPGEGVKVTVDPNLATTRTDGGAKTTRVLAYVGGAGKIALHWKPKPVELAAAKPMLLAETRLTATYGEGVLRTDVRLAYRILRAPVDTFTVTIPEDVRVLFVQGKDLRDWKVEGTGDGRRLLVALHTAARDAYQLSLTLETAAGDLKKPIPVPEVVENGVLRSQGVIVVRGPRDTQIRAGDAKGVFRLNLARLPRDLASDRNVLAYRVPGHPWSLPLLIERIRPRITVVERTVVTIGERTREARSQFDVTVARAGIFQLALSVPRDLNLLEVGPAALVEDWRLEDPEGPDRRLVVDLKGRREGAFTLSVVGEAPFTVGAEDVEAPLPLLGPLGVDRLSGTVGVRADESFELKTASRTGLDPLDPATAGGRLGQAPNKPLRGLVMAFRYQGTERSAVLTVRRKRSEVSADSVTRVEVEENRALLRANLDFTIRFAGVDTFAFSLPASLPEDDVVVTAQGLKEKTTRLEEEGERRVWTITTQSKVRGRLRVRIESHLAFEALEAGGTETIVVPDLRVSDVVREQHWYAVTKDPVLEISSETDRVEVVDPRELPPEAREEGAFLAFRTLEQPHRLGLRVTRHDYVALLDTVINLLRIETKMSREGAALHTATLSLRTSGRQYLPVWMPGKAKIQEIEVDGKTQRPRSDEDGTRTLIPLKSESAAGGEKVSTIRIVYREDVDLGGFLSDSFRLAAPRFTKDGEGVPVSGTAWTVWLPTDVLVTSIDGNMSRSKPYRTWVRRAIDRYLPRARANRGRIPVDSPDTVQRRGPRITFSRAQGGAEVGISFGSPSTFAFLQILFVLVAAAAGVFVPRRLDGHRTTVCLSLVILPLALLAFAGPGWARILNGVLVGGALAGIGWIAVSLFGIGRTWWENRPEPAPLPDEGGETSDEEKPADETAGEKEDS